MEIREMEYYVEVCEHKSILKASKSLHLTQQALSKSMKKIENDLGVNLFLRGTNSINLTENGEFLYIKVKTQLERYHAFLKEIENKFHNKTKVLRLGVVPGTLRALGADILLNFIESNTGIKLEITEVYDKICEQMVRENKLDLAIVTKPDNLDRLEYVSIKSENLLLVSHPKYGFVSGGTVQVTELQEIPIVLCDQNFNLRTHVEEEFQRHGLQPYIVFDVNEIEISMDLVAKGKAVNICAQHVTQGLENKAIVVSQIADWNPVWEVGVITRTNHENSKEVHALIALLTQK